VIDSIAPGHSPDVTQTMVRLSSLLLLIPGCPQAPPAADEQGDSEASEEQGDDEADTDAADADETGSADVLVDACFGEDVPDGDCGASGLFEWDGTRCVEVCASLDPIENTLFDAHDCFAAHAQCIDAEQCELAPVGVTDVSGYLMQAHPGLHAGAFRADRLYLGPDAFDVGAALTSEFGTDHGVVYPQVLGIVSVSGTDWQVGVHDVTVTELGNWSGASGTMTIESVTTEGNPNEWRLRGQIEVDENGMTLSGSFEVAGCVL
jgi:hypothetical protein